MVIVQCKVTKDAEEIQPTVTQIIRLPSRNATTAGNNSIPIVFYDGEGKIFWVFRRTPKTFKKVIFPSNKFSFSQSTVAQMAERAP